MELTDPQRQHLTAVLVLWEPAGRAPTREQVRSYLDTTASAVTQVIDALEEKGAVTITWSPTENDEVITPTNEGRAAL